MNRNEKVARLSTSGKAHEDIGIAIQHFAALGDTREATVIELVANAHAGDIRRALESVELWSFPDRANQILRVCESILEGKRPASERFPLVITGQGDYTREVHAEDLEWGRPSKLWGRIKSRFATEGK
jgi:hypothetical protein